MPAQRSFSDRHCVRPHKADRIKGLLDRLIEAPRDQVDELARLSPVVT
jgi:hypothetical protein